MDAYHRRRQGHECGRFHGYVGLHRLTTPSETRLLSQRASLMQGTAPIATGLSFVSLPAHGQSGCLCQQSLRWSSTISISMYCTYMVLPRARLPRKDVLVLLHPAIPSRILVGGPGCCKETQSIRLSEHLMVIQIPHWGPERI